MMHIRFRFAMKTREYNNCSQSFTRLSQKIMINKDDKCYIMTRHE